MAMTKYEFCSHTVRWSVTPGFDAIRDLGKDGWQIAGVVRAGEYETTFYMQREVPKVFKRPPAKPPRHIG